MDEREYQTKASAELRDLVDALDELAARDERFEVELASDILTLEFPDGAKFVINSHRAARQIWMAADKRAWHFDWAGQDWRTTKDDQELWSVINEMLSRKLGTLINLKA
ncbi:MAG TPA: iron donor protein CyaY [Polyangiaceae bacterium]|jgi:CyaY protein|nr:iron donor protein CyaY [Polyangiaceae bacterium]